MKRSISWSIYLLTWFILVLLQSLLISQNSPTVSPFWQTPSHYLSTWLLDIYLIILFYTNYYVVSRSMMRRKLFTAYSIFGIATALIALFFPVMCQSVFGWSTPMQEGSLVSISWSGAIGAITVITIGLAIRALQEWIRLLDYTHEQTKTIDTLKQENTTLKAEIQLQKSSTETPTTTTTTTSCIDTLPDGL